MIEIKLNMIISKNPQLTSSLDRSVIHPLNKNYSNCPFNNY